MTQLTIELPSASFLVRAPTEVLESLRHFYPRSIHRFATPQARAQFDLQPEGAHWKLLHDGQPVGSFSNPIHALLALEFEIETSVAKVSKEHVALHAGGVVTKNGAWLIAGHPDTGKTSTTFQLLELDQAFLCEEVALYEPATRRVFPHLQTLSVAEELLQEFRVSFSVKSGELINLDNQVTRFAPRRVCESPTVLQAVLLPRFRPGETPAIESLTPESVLAEFLGYCFPPQHGEEALFDAAIGLLESARIYRLTYGSARQARGLLARLLSSAPPSRP